MKNQLLKVKQVALRLNISLSKTYALIWRGEISSVRVGRIIRVCPQDLKNFIIANTSGLTAYPTKAKLAGANSELGSPPENHPSRGGFSYEPS
jgi:excisionase family DNA binding protein